MGTVNKGDLIKATAAASGMTTTAAQQAVDAFLAAVKDRAESGDTVRLTGFGSFSVKARPGRLGRNPATGEVIAIPESRKLTFKASKAALA